MDNVKKFVWGLKAESKKLEKEIEGLRGENKNLERYIYDLRIIVEDLWNQIDILGEKIEKIVNENSNHDPEVKS